VTGLADSHCHLDQRQFDADREAVLARAAASGVTLMVNPGVDLPSSAAAAALAEQHAGVYAAVGVHPHDAKTLDVAGLRNLKRLSHSHKVVAIGEIGLDYYRDLSPRDVQRRAFRQQLELAAELDVPVVVHDRDAHDDTLAILSAWRAALDTRHSTVGVLHSFSGDVAIAEQALALGFFIGVSGPVTFKNAQRLREVVKAVPLERLLVETDAPYLTPHPYRGQRNEPAFVRCVVQAIADIRQLTLEQVSTLARANTAALFTKAVI
jgi:TatD DNase family protein